MVCAMNQPMAAGRNQHWAQINEFSCLAGMRLLYWLARLLGRWPFRLALYPVLLWYLVTQPAARRASKEYLKRLSSLSPTGAIDCGMVGVMRHFASFGESILDKMLLWSGSFDTDSVIFHGLDLIVGQIDAQRGGILLCCHLGNLELCRVLSRRQAGLKLTVLLHTKHAVRFNQLLAQLDPNSQLSLMQVTELDPAAAAMLAAKVALGEFVAIAGDRIPVSANPRVALAKFLGDSAPFPIGPYVLASLFQCPVYLLFSMRSREHWEIHFELFREFIRLPRRRRSETLSALVAEYATRLESYCARAPLEWFNFYDFWNLPKPDGADASH
jgi:predicted LPLAT superfamily acyltransferase